MPGVYEIRSMPGGEVRRYFGSRGNYYELGDGTRLDVHTQPVWCRRCEELTDGEEIPSLADFDRELARFFDPNSEFYWYTKDLIPPPLDQVARQKRFRRNGIDETRLRRRWREGRRSGPKCIECGSTDIVVFPLNEPVPHPTAEGTIAVRIIGLCSTDFNNWFFTPEGDRIRRGAGTIYGHHPAPGERSGLLSRVLRRIARSLLDRPRP